MNDPAAHAETLVKKALDHLEATGALQPSNWMDITGLLNLAVETINAFDVMGEDIFESVMDAKRLQEGIVMMMSILMCLHQVQHVLMHSRQC
jgi:hypothetical protein